MLVCSKDLNNNLSLQVFSSVSTIDADTWNTINNKIPFYKTHQFLSVIEKIQKDIQFRYVLIKKNEVVYAALYMQALDFSFKNLVNYNSGNTGTVKSAVKNYIGKKNTKLLNLGNVFFTGDNGVICNDEEEIIAIIPDVFDITAESFSGKKPSASLIANIYLQDKEKCSVFRHNAYHSFITEPDMFMNMDEKWNNFEDYLNTLSSKYRVRAKKVLQTSAEIIQKEFSLEDILLNKNLLEKLYNNVVNHIAFNMANLNIDFFEEMKKLYGEKCTVLGYYLNDELISFACLFHVDDAILHVHYIGMNYEINKEYKLYNRMLLDFVRFAIFQKKKFIHFGRTATEIKTTIGAKPNPLQAYLKMNNSLFNMVLPFFLKRIKPADFITRNPFK